MITKNDYPCLLITIVVIGLSCCYIVLALVVISYIFTIVVIFMHFIYRTRRFVLQSRLAACLLGS